MGKFFYEVNDFIMMRPYDKKYEVSPSELGIKTKHNENIFDSGSGVQIG